MAPATRTIAALEQLRLAESWTEVAAFDGVDAARAYAAGAEWLREPALRARMTACLTEAQAMAQAALSNPVRLVFARQGRRGHLSLLNDQAGFATTWDFDLGAVDGVDDEADTAAGGKA